MSMGCGSITRNFERQKNFEDALPEIAFGKADWERHFGLIGKDLILPFNIGEILKSPCPFWEGKLIEETHALALIPSTINGRPLTLNVLHELMKDPKLDQPTQIFDFAENARNEFGDIPVKTPHWILITKDIIPKSRHIKSKQRLTLLENYEDYKIPTLLEIVTAMLVHYVSTGEKIYPVHYSMCEEKVEDGWHVAVGHFIQDGMSVIDGYSMNNGAGGVRSLQTVFC